MISRVVQDGKVAGRNAYNHPFLYCKSSCKEQFYVLAHMSPNDTANHIYDRTPISFDIYSSIEPLFHK